MPIDGDFWKWKINLSVIAALTVAAPVSAIAQTISGDRIDAIEKQINELQGELKSLKHELADTKEKLRRRVMLDCYYIEHWSFGFDLWIIMRTAAQLLIDRNAY